jgi:hypothetical protein
LSEICYYISDMRDLTLKVLKRAKAAGPGSALTPRVFDDLGNRAAVDQALSRLTKAGKIRRISRGVYDVPRHHPTLGPLSPDPDAVARAIADQSGYRLQPTPARAANALGLSIFSMRAQGPCWERVLPRVLLCRRFVRLGRTTLAPPSSSSFGKTCHQLQRQD